MRRADCITVWGLKQQNVIVIQFWKLKFKIKVSAGHASPLVSGGLLVILGIFWLEISAFILTQVFSLCTCLCPNFPFFIRAPVILD